MKIIYKYPVADNPIEVSVGYKILKIALIRKLLYIWILSDLDVQEKVSLQFKMYGTGWPNAPEYSNYVDTVIESDLVWHIFYDEL